MIAVAIKLSRNWSRISRILELGFVMEGSGRSPE